MSRELLETLQPGDWDSQKPGANTGFQRVRWLQGLNDLVKRPVANRGQVSGAAVAVNTNGAVQSTGIGIPAQLQPKRYSEFTVKAQLTYQINSAGPVFVHVYRTLGSIPAKGAAPNAGDVPVGGGPFAGGPTTNGVNQAASFSFLDSGLDQTKKYLYYLTVQGPNGNALSLAANAQLLVMERS